MDIRHLLTVLTSFLLYVCTAEGVRWCGYQDEWRKGYATITYRHSQGLTGDGHSFNFTSGVFTSPQHGRYQVTVSAVVGGMLPPKPGDILMKTSPVYAQIFLKLTEGLRIHNREYITDENSYLVVKEGEVASLMTSVILAESDTLELETGHVTTSKYNREAYNHHVTNIPGGFLEDITFCIIKKPSDEL